MNERLLPILIISGVLVILIFFAWLKQRKKDRQPTITIRATVRSKSPVTTSVRGPYGLRNIHGYQVTFDLADGSRVALSVPENFGKYPDGTTGTLTYHDTKCERFDPDQ